MKKALLIVLSVITIISCSSSETEVSLQNGILTGEFIEISPQANRTTLSFTAEGDQMEEQRLSDGGNAPIKTFTIQLLDNDMIELSSNEADEAMPQVVHYKVIDNDNFEIGSFNNIDSESSIISFKRR